MAKFNHFKCKYCGNEFKAPGFVDVHSYTWYTKFGIRCPRCNSVYYGSVQIIGICILGIVIVGSLIKIVSSMLLQ